MKLAVLLLMVVSTAFGVQKGIYGEDNRREVVDVADNLLNTAAQATASMISRYKLSLVDEEIVISDNTTLRQKHFLCADEPFANQPAPVDCSGFLIAPDVLVTAGHCLMAKDSCKNNLWVFKYHTDEDGNAPTAVARENVYACKGIIEGELDPFFFGRDHAIIRLDRAVEDVTPLKFRTSGEIDIDAKLAVIGNPSGLPTKIADDGHVKLNSNPYWFSTNLDTFGGNSGSAVIDAESGEVEGVLVRGDQDYYLDRVKRCYRAKIYTMDSTGMGEHVTRITNSSFLKSL